MSAADLDRFAGKLAPWWRGAFRNLWSLRPPIHRMQFWIATAGVAAIAVFHIAFLDDLRARLPLGYPPSITAILLLIPVIYAALNFGVRGAVATALWATLLMVPDVAIDHADDPRKAWIEVSVLLVVNAIAIVVGQRVERELRARHRAEAALRSSEIAQTRYHALFEQQRDPLLIVDDSGHVTEANAAAHALFGDTRDRVLESMLPPATERPADEPAQPFVLTDPRGVPHWYVQNTRFLALVADTSTTQVELTDVTQERRRQEEQRDYAARLLTVQEEERRSLARELHDDPLQTLMFLVRSLGELADTADLPADAAAQVRRDGELADEVVMSLRKLIRGLRPPVLDDLGIVAALNHLAAEVQERCHLPVDVHIHGAETRLPAQTELTSFRITQEALSNTVRHAHADRAVVHLRFGADITLRVIDDGLGVSSTSRSKTSSGGLGIPGMRERLNLLDGSLTVRPGRTGGTVVTARVPARPHDAGPAADETVRSSVCVPSGILVHRRADAPVERGGGGVQGDLPADDPARRASPGPGVR